MLQSLSLASIGFVIPCGPFFAIMTCYEPVTLDLNISHPLITERNEG